MASQILLEWCFRCKRKLKWFEIEVHSGGDLSVPAEWFAHAKCTCGVFISVDLSTEESEEA